MDKKRWWIREIVLFATLLALLAAVRGLSSPTGDPAALYYQATCAIVEANTVDGYVSNLSQDFYQVNGSVRFTFAAINSMSRPDILVPADISIPPGQTVLVARTRPAFQLRPGETCLFDVKSAIRKQ